MTIAKWFVEKNYTASEAYAMSTVEPKIVSETEKAYRLAFGTEFGDIVGWFPKSVCSSSTVQKKAFSAGDKVSHKIFGEGTISSISGQIATVNFNGVEKVLSAAYLN